MTAVLQPSFPIECPEFFLGPTSRVRKLWRSIARRAWKDGSWDAAFQDCNMVPLESDSSPIVVATHGDGWKSNESVWQLNWITDEAMAPLEELSADVMKHHDLFLNGLSQCWYCLGSLAASSHYLLPFFTTLYDGPSSIAFYRPVLERYVQWLPEIFVLFDRFVLGYPGAGLVPLPNSVHLSDLTSLFRMCGYASPEEAVALIHSPVEVWLEHWIRQEVVQIKDGRTMLTG